MSGKIKKLKNTYTNMSVQARAAIWYAICSFIQKGIVFLTTPIFSRLMTKTEFGIFNIFTSWQSIIIIFASLNLASGVYLRGLIKYEEDEEEFSASLHSLFTLIFFAVFAVYLIFSGFWNTLFSLPTEYMLCMFADMLAAVAFHFWSSYQRVQYTYRKLIVVTILNAFLRPVLGVAAIFMMENNVAARIYSMTIADVLCFGGFFIAFFVGRHKKISVKYWKYALLYNLPLVPHYLSQIVLNQSDRIMIERLVSADSAGVYSLAYTTALIMYVINQALLNSYNPWMYRNIKEGKFKEINDYSIQLLILIGAANLGLIIFAPEFISILGPKSYHEAIWIIPPVAMSNYFIFMYSLFSNFEFYYEKTHYMMIASVTGAALNVLLNYLMIPVYGYMAAGYTTLICYLGYCLAHYLLMRWILKKEIGKSSIYNMKHILGFSILFMTLGFTFMGFYNFTAVRYITIVIMAAIVVYKRKYFIELLNSIRAKKKKSNS